MKKKLYIILLCLLCCACTNSKTTIKEEYEKYNKEYVKVDLTNANIVKYSNTKEINKIIKNKSGVIYIGSPKNNQSRVSLEILLQAAENTGLDKIYYITSTKEIEGLEEIENKNIPLVLFVLEGKIESYYQGTIEGKTKLSEDETLEIYNTYTEGIHKVLQDTCDEEC